MPHSIEANAVPPLVAKLKECREALDEMELWMAAACLNDAIHHLENQRNASVR
ncbi:hypothetical protein ACBY01_00365 [Sphingomonas sp. ac-8]|uniref:hypothetical protein n=1 Tax=Sphingomonas sp. ac-8 TaxID=3242977 RepID=UPI003A805471